MIERNPYTAPTVNVEGLDQADARSSSRPPRVTIAVRLLWASFVISFVPVVVSLVPITIASDTALGYVLGRIAIAGFVVALIYIKISRGRNWARIVQAVLVAIAVFGAFFTPLTDVSDSDSLATVVSRLTTFVELTATAMLFTKPASPWFRRRS